MAGRACRRPTPRRASPVGLMFCSCRHGAPLRGYERRPPGGYRQPHQHHHGQDQAGQRDRPLLSKAQQAQVPHQSGLQSCHLLRSDAIYLHDRRHLRHLRLRTSWQEGPGRPGTQGTRKIVGRLKPSYTVRWHASAQPRKTCSPVPIPELPGVLARGSF